MTLYNIRKQSLLTSLFIFICLSFSLVGTAISQDESIEALTREARKLVDENRYIDALPLLEKIILSYPNNGEMWADFGIAIVSNATTMTDTAERKKEMERGIKALTRAKKLGTTNTRALYFLDQFEDFDGTDNFSNDNPEVEKYLREGEAYFGRADYDAAFKSYEKAYKIDPKNYEAVLFMGDCFYAQKKYKEAESYFIKAIEINPDVETAYRFLGDAYFYQNKDQEALDKFLEAVLIEPYSRMTWDSLRKWAGKTNANYDLIKIVPPGSEEYGSIKINESLLKAEDGTDKWKLYNETVKDLMANKSATDLEFTLSDEIKAWRRVADAVRVDMKSGKIKYPDQSLINLLKLDDKNLIESYILLLRPQDSFLENYVSYRKENRQKMKQFIREFILNLKN